MASVLAVLIALAVWSSSAVAQLPPFSGSSSTVSTTVRTAPLTERERAVHLLSRVTYGVRPADVDELLRVGADTWLDAQLAPASIADEELIAALGPLAVRAAPQSMRPNPSIASGPRVDMSLDRLVVVKLLHASVTRRQLEEVMTTFWFNHFNVYYQKAGIRIDGINSYRGTIRTKVFGRFEDLLLSVAQHSAMLAYLDNYLSTVPGADVPGGGGLNENYARELLELHTLGVDGGYTQQDVIEVARAFTGWSVLMAAAAGSFGVPMGGGQGTFRAEWHDSGAKVVLGHTLPAARGMEDGRDVIALLARHPSTAEHIATKLVQHFVADQPPPDLVREIAAVFLATDGDLRAVARALFTSEAFYRPEHYRSKVKRPFELLASTLRLTESRPARNGETSFFLRGLGHLPYAETSPMGYPLHSEHWMSAAAVLARVQFGMAVGDGVYLESPINPWRFLGWPELDSATLVDPSARGATRWDTRAITRRVLDRLLTDVPSPSMEETIVRSLGEIGVAVDLPTLVARTVALVVGSPDFQRY